MSERTEGREETRTVAAEGRRYGSHAGPNAAGRRAREPLALRGGRARVRHRAPQPPRRRHHAAALLLEPRGTRGPAGRDAGAERAPGERAGRGVSGVSRATSWARAAPRGTRQVIPSPAFAGSSRGERAELTSCLGLVDPRFGAACTAERPGGKAPGARDGRWAAGWSCSCRATRLGLGFLTPVTEPVARTSSGTRSCLARGPGGGRGMAASPQREGVRDAC